MVALPLRVPGACSGPGLWRESLYRRQVSLLGEGFVREAPAGATTAQQVPDEPLVFCSREPEPEEGEHMLFGDVLPVSAF